MNNKVELLKKIKDHKYYLENFCKIKTKQGGLHPFILNEAQKDLFNALNTNSRVIILKSRQLGFSTAVTGYFYVDTIVRPGITTALIGYNADMVQELLDKVKTFFHTTPLEFRPTVEYNSKREISFPKTQSKILVLSNTKDVGRGYTIHNCLHSDTNVFVKNNEIKKIKNINIGEYVLNGNCEYDIVKSKSKLYYSGYILKLIIDGLPKLLLTRDHKIKIRKNNKIYFERAENTKGCQIAYKDGWYLIKNITEKKYNGFVYDIGLKNEPHSFMTTSGVCSNCLVTELSSWDSAEEKMLGLEESIPPGGKLVVESCVVGNTLILTDNGLKYIKNIHDWDNLGFSTGKDILLDGHYGLKPTNTYYNSGIRKGFKIITKNGYEIGMSSVHKLFVLEDSELKFKKAKDLKVGDKLTIKYGQELFPKSSGGEIAEWKREELVKLFKIIFNKNLIYECEDNEFLRVLQVILLNFGIISIRKKNVLSISNNFKKIFIDKILNGKFVEKPKEYFYNKIKEIIPIEENVYDFTVDDGHTVIYNGFVGHQTPRGMGNLYHRLWMEEDNGYEKKMYGWWWGYCIDDDTEILTMDGWKKRKDFKIGEKHFTVNLETEEVEIKKAINKFEYDYDGKMLHFNNNNIDMLVTPNHNCIYKTFNYHNIKNKWKLKKAIDIKTSDKMPLTTNGWHKNKTKKYSDEFVELIGWITAEASFERYLIYIYQNIGKNLDRIEELCKILNLKYTKYLRRNRICGEIRIHSESTKEIRKILYNKKSLPLDFILELTYEQLIILKDTLIEADGYKNINNEIFTQKEKIFADNFQILATLIGANSNLFQRKQKDKCYNVRIKKCNFVGNIKKKYKYYKGKVWCPENENGTIIIRRNGKVMLTGQSKEQMRKKEKEIGKVAFAQEYGCFVKGTSVITNDGVKNIEDINVGDYVLAHSNRYRKVLATSVRDYCNDIYKIHSYGNSIPIVCTEEHPFRICNDGKNNKWVEAHKLKKGDSVTFAKPLLKKNKIISEDLLKVIGWFITEGNYWNKIINFSLSIDEEENKHELIESLKKLTNNKILVRKKDGKAISIDVNDCELGEFLIKHCGSGAANKKIPFELIAGYEKLLYDILIKGDGCVVTSIKDQYCTISKMLAYQIQLLAHSLSYRSGISINKGHFAKFQNRDKEIYCKDIYTIRIYKKRIFPGTKAYKLNKIKLYKYNVAAKIRKIDKEYRSTKVYNLEVDIDNSYTANGRVVHNCKFLASGRNVFDTEIIDFQFNNILKDGDVNKLDPDNEFTVVRDNQWRIYRPPEPDGIYVVGADSSEGVEGGDYSVGVVWNRKTGEEVAFFRELLPPELFAVRLDYIGRKYNNALMIPETNSHGLLVVNRLREGVYPNIYFRQGKFDAIGMSFTDRLGWRTTGANRELLIDDFARVLREKALFIHSRELLNEMAVFVYDDNGRMKPEGKSHDDCIFAAAIGFQGFKILYSGKLEQIDYTKHLPQSYSY